MPGRCQTISQGKTFSGMLEKATRSLSGRPTEDVSPLTQRIVICQMKAFQVIGVFAGLSQASSATERGEMSRRSRVKRRAHDKRAFPLLRASRTGLFAQILYEEYGGTHETIP